MTTGMRPALRLARREILRHRWRSLLVLILIGLPVMVSVAAVTLIETGSIDSSEADPYTYASAQHQAVWEDAGSTLTEDQVRAKLTSLTDLPVVDDTWAPAQLVDGVRGWEVQALRTDFDSPLTDGVATVLQGHLPTEPDEIAVTPDLAHDGLDIGATVSMGNAEVTVVGVASSIGNARVVTNGIFVPAESAAVLLADGQSYPTNFQYSHGWTFLVGGPDDAPLTDAQRQTLSQAGFTIGAPGEAAWSMAGPDSTDTQLIALVVTCLLIEIVLLAGPAFAVGVRRQRHALALLAVAGGSPRDIRRAVLAQAVVLGLLGSVVGALAAIPLTWAGLWVAARGWGLVVGPFDIGWVAVVPAIVLGTLSAVLAALIPARIAARADVVTALAGRQPTPRIRRGWPILGAVVLAFGTLGCIASLGRAYGYANGWWAVVSVCGAVMMTPWLIAVIARLAPRLPLPFRLALRDADRHRSRSAPAVAAVMASVAAVVALGIGSASDQASGMRIGGYQYPIGTVTLSVETADQMARTVAAIEEQTGVRFTPLSRLGGYSFETAAEAVPENAYTIVAADPTTLKRWGVTLDDTATAQLLAGKALVDPSVITTDGAVTLSAWDDAGNESDLRLPAVEADLTMKGEAPAAAPPIIAGIVVSPETARAFGLVGVDGNQEAIADDPSAADSPEVRAAAGSVSPFGWTLLTEQGWHSDYWLILGLLSLLAVFTVLLGTFSATGLALNDARHDMATLSAVGARPATRKVVAGTHAFLIAFLGAVLGIAVGFTPGIAAAYLLTHVYGDGWVLRIPWMLLVLLLVILPLVAGGITTLVSRSRTISLRRAA